MNGMVRVVLLLAAALSLASGCTKDYVTGKYTFNLYGEDDEVAMGRQADPAIVAEYGLYPDDELAAYVAALGQKVAKSSQRPQLEYTFRLLDSPVVNAFALPGGYVYITRGILAHFNSEDELVGVVGHEVGHVVARHGVEQMSRQAIAGAGVGLINMVKVPLIGDIAGTSAGLLFLSFSRDQESESDRLGVEYSTRLGYDANRMADFFQTLDRLSEGSGQSLPGFLSTHPDPGDREVRVHQLATEWQREIPYKPKNTDPADYLKRIEGIVYGDDPRQGFVEDGKFYHPELAFEFPVPDGWQVLNTPSVVQMSDGSKKAVISFSVPGETTAAAAADSFLARSGASVLSRESARVNGVPAVAMESRVTNQDTDIRILSYFIAMDGRVYTFHGFSYADVWSDYAAVFRTVMTGFARVTNQRILAVKPERIKLVRAPRTDTMEALLVEFGFGGERVAELSILNGRRPSDRVGQGQWLKIVGR